jgi:hypothetical protein
MPKNESKKPKTPSQMTPRPKDVTHPPKLGTVESISRQGASTVTSKTGAGKTRTKGSASSTKQERTVRHDTTPTPWVIHSKDQGDPDPKWFFGFLYLIYNKKNDKKYIGKKQYKRYQKNKPVGYTDWATYKGSSKYLNQDIKKYGVSNFIFIMIRQFETRGGLTYYEANAQHKLDALTSRLDGVEDREYYNANIMGIKFIPKEVVPEFNQLLEEIINDYCKH